MNRLSIVLSFALVVLCTLAIACSAPLNSPQTETGVPFPPTPTSQPVVKPTDESSQGVAIRLSSESSQLTPGSAVTLNVLFEPVIQTVIRRSDGSISSVSQKLWPNHPVTQMSYCVALDGVCTPPTNWKPFSSREKFPLTIDWIGEREIWIVAQFRDQNGGAVPGIDEEGRTGPLARASTGLVARIDEGTPDTAQAPLVQTLVAKTRVAFPVRGSVEIAGGNCCVGGKVGTTVEIPVKFEARSPAGQVTEMRVGHQCPGAGKTLDTSWEPFAASKTYTSTAVINFVGWYIAVQYRDTEGNLSPVYCDDISVEGSP